MREPLTVGTKRKGYVCECCNTVHSPLTFECICGGRVSFTDRPSRARAGTPAPSMGRAAARIAYRKAWGMPMLERDKAARADRRGEKGDGQAQ